MNKSDKNLATLNISLQSKKYNAKINNLIRLWRKKGYNISTVICDELLLFDKIDNSIMFTNLLNIYSLISKNAENRYPDNEQKAQMLTEEIFMSIIKIDTNNLGTMLYNTNPIQIPNNKNLTDDTVITDHSKDEYDHSKDECNHSKDECNHCTKDINTAKATPIPVRKSRLDIMKESLKKSLYLSLWNTH